MKKVVLFLAVIAVSIPLFGLSYDDNEYQRKSRAYSELANKAFDEGDYAAAIEYAAMAEDYAVQSSDFIKKMLAKTEAEQEMNKARTRYTWAKNNRAEEKYPEAFLTASEALNAGSAAFDKENYDVAVVCAQKVLKALADVKGDESGFAGLPAQYKIRTWRGEKDCLWNIAALPGVYGNPFMWRKLYEANKSKLPDKKNPNWVEPGIIIIIPPIKGEKRSGMYDHSKVYKKLP